MDEALLIMNDIAIMRALRMVAISDAQLKLLDDQIRACFARLGQIDAERRSGG